MRGKQPKISLDLQRKAAIQYLSAFAPVEFLEREPLDRLLLGLKDRGAKICSGCHKAVALAQYRDPTAAECLSCNPRGELSRKEWFRRYQRRYRARKRGSKRAVDK